MSSFDDHYRLAIIAVLHGSTQENHHQALRQFVEENCHDPHNAFIANMSLWPIISLIADKIDAIDPQRHFPICLVLESILDLFDSIRPRLWELNLTDATRWLQFIAKVNACHSKIIEHQFPSCNQPNDSRQACGGVQIFTLRRNSPLSTGVDQEESVEEKIEVEPEESRATADITPATYHESHLILEAHSQVEIGVLQLLPVKHPPQTSSISRQTQICIGSF